MPSATTMAGNKTTSSQQLAADLELDKTYKDCVTATLALVGANSKANNNLNAGHSAPTHQQQQEQDLLLNKVSLSRARDCLDDEQQRSTTKLPPSFGSNLICVQEAVGTTETQTDTETKVPTTTTTTTNGDEYLASGRRLSGINGEHDDTTRVLICSTVQASRLR